MPLRSLGGCLADRPEHHGPAVEARGPEPRQSEVEPRGSEPEPHGPEPRGSEVEPWVSKVDPHGLTKPTVIGA